MYLVCHVGHVCLFNHVAILQLFMFISIKPLLTVIEIFNFDVKDPFILPDSEGLGAHERITLAE